jgi:hypothetical protein
MCAKASMRPLRAGARKVLGWPKRSKLAHAFRWEYSYERLKLAQLLGQLGDFLTGGSGRGRRAERRADNTASARAEAGGY